MSFKSLEAFEAEAELFYKDTGYLAPGKSEPAAWGSRAYEREAMRRKVKDAWDAGRRRGLPDAERDMSTNTNPPQISIDEREAVEVLAAVEHERWSWWMKYLFELTTQSAAGTRNIPAWAVERWTRQMNTPYAEISEKEKESDRIEARKTLAALARLAERRGER